MVGGCGTWVAGTSLGWPVPGSGTHAPLTTTTVRLCCKAVNMFDGIGARPEPGGGGTLREPTKKFWPGIAVHDARTRFICEAPGHHPEKSWWVTARNGPQLRSEERRVGKECRSRWS